jgi:hypothetical protein
MYGKSPEIAAASETFSVNMEASNAELEECSGVKSVECHETAVTIWETDPSETVADCHLWWRLGRQKSTHCCKSFSSNT